MIEHIKLRIWGQANGGLYQSLQSILPLDNHGILLFCDYSEHDIPVGVIFNKVEDACGAIVYEKPFELTSVTQQYHKKFDSIPRGWKTICLFKFKGAPPSCVLSLPKLDGWISTESPLFFTI